MARTQYGGSAADVVLTRTSLSANLLTAGGETTSLEGGVVAISFVPETLTVWEVEVGGTRVTDLLDITSEAKTVVLPDENGRIRFFGEDGYDGTYWLDDGTGGTRWAVRPTEASAGTSEGLYGPHYIVW
jgi:hypothetical protein